jgi:mRNA interferase MazF
MENDFDIWNIKKQLLDKKKRKLLFKEGEIWWCSVGKNIGEEVYGKGSEFRRPVIVFRKLTNNSCIVIPTSTKQRIGSWYHHINVVGKDRWAIMHQMRYISANRLWVRESSLSFNEFKEFKKSVAKLLGL